MKKPENLVQEGDRIMVISHGKLVGVVPAKLSLFDEDYCFVVKAPLLPLTKLKRKPNIQGFLGMEKDREFYIYTQKTCTARGFDYKEESK